MLAHNVFFTLKDPAPGAIASLLADCKSDLAKDPGVVSFHCGVREPELSRPVNVLDFQVGVHIVFKDRAAHDAYQVSPAHKRFVEANKDNWEQSRVFDTIVEPPE